MQERIINGEDLRSLRSGVNSIGDVVKHETEGKKKTMTGVLGRGFLRLPWMILCVTMRQADFY